MIDLECFAIAVGQADEGVCLLLRIGPYRILLDCGLDDIAPLCAKESTPPDFVFCSHAHADHARGLLALHRAFPQLPIYGSQVTAQLMSINWPAIQDGLTPERFCQPLDWHTQVTLLPNLTVELIPAGHLPGAAVIIINYTSPQKTYKIVYTGDYFLSNSRLVDGLALGKLRGLKPDVLILEGTYGTARHPHRRQLENQLAERIYRAIVQGYSILLPTSPLGLGQELLMLLRSHHYFTGRELDIWVDGNVILGCDLYLEILPYLPASVQNFAQHQPLFWDERIRPRVRKLSPEQYRSLGQTPCVVITDNTHNFSNYFHPEMVGWLVLNAQKPGRLPLNLPSLEMSNNDGDRELPIEFQAIMRQVSPLIQLEDYLLAEHCDGAATTQLIHNLRPQHIIFLHGCQTYLDDLANLDELRNRYQIHTPTSGTLVELPIGETFLRPIVPEVNYEGELTEYDQEVIISLPQDITEHPRWLNLADTGLIEARWQGEELVIRGLSQREVLSQAIDRVFPADQECCGNCIYFRGQRCWSQQSPLFGFKVTPDGYCPVFQSIHLTVIEDSEEIDIDDE